MTDVYISFDTEDFTSNLSSDAIRDQANLLHEFGIRGNFNIVGLLARELVRNNRTDVIDALKNHVISSHSYGHSLHPTLCEYTDDFDYDKAHAECLKQEATGIGMVLAATGRDRVIGANPPGNSFSYVAMYTYAELGLKIYPGSLFDTADGEGVYCCNLFHTNYETSLEGLIFQPDYDLGKTLDRIASKKRFVLYNHPNMVAHRQFWDAVNYWGENKHDMFEWEDAKLRSPEQVEYYYTELRKLLTALTTDKRFRVCDPMKWIEDRDKLVGNRKVTKAMLGEIKANLTAKLSWMYSPMALSVADCFYTAKHFMFSDADYIPSEVHGFLDEPIGVSQTTVLTADEVRTLALRCDNTRFIPATFEINGKRIGPADLLFAMLDVAMGAETVTVEPKRQQCEYEAELPALANMDFENKWVNAPTFTDKVLSKRMKLQAWTAIKEIL